MSPALTAALADVPDLLRAHLVLSAAAIAIAVAIGLPLAIRAADAPRLRGPLLGIVGTFQTIPGLALLALFYPALLLLGEATGTAIPALGFLPALLALTLYAMLPIVRNALTAIEGLDPAYKEAALGLGLTRLQRLRKVELPLGAPVIIAGIRTATVWTVGTATLATTIGQPSLGNLIFSGLQTEDWTRVLVGCGASAGLALAADALLGQVERGIATRAPRRWGGALLALAAAFVAALSIPLFANDTARSDGPGDNRLVVVGAKNFSEQYILAALIEDKLRGAGFATDTRENLGSAVAYRALAQGDIDVYVDYSGTLWANVLERDDRPERAAMLAVLRDELARRDGVRLLGELGFENAYAFAMKRSRAEALRITTLADLAREGGRLSLGSDLEFLSRPEWASVVATYDMRFASSNEYSPTFMYRAIDDGTVDAISAFSSDGRIAALDLVTLDDPSGALPRYDAVLLLSAKAAADEDLVAALSPLVGAIDIDAMRRANLMVDREKDKRTPGEAARQLLE